MAGLTVSGVPSGYEPAWTEGTMGVEFSVFTTASDETQIAIGRWKRTREMPISRSPNSEDISVAGRLFTVTEHPGGETRVWEDLDGGVRVEVVGRQVATQALLDLILNVQYDPQRDDL